MTSPSNNKERSMTRGTKIVYLLGHLNMAVGLYLLFLDISQSMNKGAVILFLTGLYNRLTVIDHTLGIIKDDEAKSDETEN